MVAVIPIVFLIPCIHLYCRFPLVVSRCGCLDLIFVQRAEFNFIFLFIVIFLCWSFTLYKYFIIKGSLNPDLTPKYVWIVLAIHLGLFIGIAVQAI